MLPAAPESRHLVRRKEEFTLVLSLGSALQWFGLADVAGRVGPSYESTTCSRQGTLSGSTRNLAPGIRSCCSGHKTAFTLQRNALTVPAQQELQQELQLLELTFDITHLPGRQACDSEAGVLCGCPPDWHSGLH